ncbi:MAG: cupin-like domain-containing protein [Bacteriovoracaceae bacterium]|nr:cupin-like domain-containing protein [Bacteriovoracaceae bacterium]
MKNQLYRKYYFYWFLEHILGSFGASNIQEKRWLLNQQLSDYYINQPKKDFVQIDEVDSISLEDFKKEYYYKNKPVILRNFAKDWPCVQKWSPEFFKSQYPDYPMVITDYHRDRGGQNEEVLLKDYLERIDAGEAIYARFVKLLHDKPELKNDLNLDMINCLKRKSDYWVATQFFMGPPKTSTYLHCAFINNFFVQCYGEKDWLLMSPKYNALFHPPTDHAPTFRCHEIYEHPSFKETDVFSHIDVYKFTVRKGDLFYNPPFHWHYVTNKTFSISLSLRIMSILSAIRSSPMLSFLTATATNPPALESLFKMTQGKNFLNFYDSKKNKLDV